ncbi:NAD-dependent malic enzyme [Klebsiella pneumoniae]|uniref:NAD-dependent malic enzyme n=1 Tax=Klebsiella pneumoniae TaxID=573 RepID=A0A377X8Z5_KLEPN|nr:NAD-dependent malic enzyme [Klebsiella pneumoniae]
MIASGASRVTDEMLMAASETLAQHSPLVNNGEGPVLPELKDIQTVSRAIAFAVGKVAPGASVAVKTSAEALLQPLAIISGCRNIAIIAAPRLIAVTGSK